MDADDLFKDIDDLGIEIESVGEQEADDEENHVVKLINDRKDKIKNIKGRNKLDFNREYDTPVEPDFGMSPEFDVELSPAHVLDEPEEEPPIIQDPVRTLTQLARLLRNNGFKVSVFNVKDTLIRYLELFGERKIARHVLDQDGYKFYEIHALYIPGGNLFTIMKKLGFEPLHPTDLTENYPKDMRYEVAMSNGKVHLNIFGGLQQHAPTEETVIRNLYEWEVKRYGIGLTGETKSSALVKQIENELKEVEITKNLVLASLQSRSLNKPELAHEFFERAVISKGIDRFIDSLANQSTFERQPYFAEISDFISKKYKDTDEITDEERSIYLKPQTAGELFQVE